MPFSKSFPRNVKGSNYPKWEDIFISDEEEAVEEQRCRLENIKLIKECIEDAKAVFEEKNLKRYQTDLIRMAIALFEKRASHSVYWKERKAKDKFDRLYSKW
jgi:DNA helicase TIP49 (TBP-interacting protein)